MEVTVDSDQILDVSLVHLNEAVSTMYPLMQPSMEELAPQIQAPNPRKISPFRNLPAIPALPFLKAVDTALLKARR